MAFIQPAAITRSSFLAQQRKSSICSNQTHHLGLEMTVRDVAANGLKIVLAAGALAATVTTTLPSEADAAIFHFRGERPANIGLRYGRYLDNCPPTPNCISSMANVYDRHFVPAWSYNALSGEPTKSTDEAVKDVTRVIEEFPGTKIIKNEATSSEAGSGHYIYAEFESKLMGFVDDVEFFFQPDKTTVEYRSASRLGENDLGANRTRIRDIRVALQDMDKRWASVGY